MNETYKKQVALLIRIMPLVYKIKDSGASKKNIQYILRWEALSPNRDQKRIGKLPQPSVLRLYELTK